MDAGFGCPDFMPTNSTLTERRHGTRDLVDKIVAERTEMLVLFCRLAGVEPYTSIKSNANLKSMLQDFCQILMDYVAAGHFELYGHINDGKERRRKMLEFGDKDYPRLVETTDVALAFNDKYDASDHSLTLDQLDNDLTRLGERLAERIEIEDRLIRTLGLRPSSE